MLKLKRGRDLGTSEETEEQRIERIEESRITTGSYNKRLRSQATHVQGCIYCKI